MAAASIRNGSDTQQQEHQQAETAGNGGHGDGDGQCRTQRARDVHFAETCRAVHHWQSRDEYRPGRRGGCHGVDQDTPGSGKHAPPLGDDICVVCVGPAGDRQTIQTGLHRTACKGIPEDRVLTCFVSHLAGIELGLDFDRAAQARLSGEEL